MVVSRSRAKLCEEAVKPAPFKATVLSLQRPTFATRREFILSGLDSVGAILEQHPVLHLPFAVSIKLVTLQLFSSKFRIPDVRRYDLFLSMIARVD